ncbi:hypothetical protein [Ferroplasma acidiphilum]|jgi:hypothetical protein|uniref:Uncharacterized protein n=2 Tax=Ferroplasma acidiphilum TaxID=74969 RepID=A0A1V0N1D3_9ARCH|nr:hypothetical protein [Ferroplasma acidiphilum]ARD83960.1 hypothetical protein FAD_0025 [Ferroplasma acidiphilum]MCL4349399.1 hypothetical protein [Candidatus Thermoplasmatota archaeon]NOL60972.1 hypothetical protein [Ferroplasma acidiphilum]WMT52862.1 MAG: hypothetical protein RE473_07575 [Ferroplasma acidiphilum]
MFEINIVESSVLYRKRKGLSSNMAIGSMQKDNREHYKRVAKAIVMVSLFCMISGAGYLSIAGVPIIEDASHMLPGALINTGTSHGNFLYYYFTHGHFPTASTWFNWLTVTMGLEPSVAILVADALGAAGWITEATADAILAASGYVGAAIGAAIAAY